MERDVTSARQAAVDVAVQSERLVQVYELLASLARRKKAMVRQESDTLPQSAS